MWSSHLSWAGVRGWIGVRLVPVLLAVVIAFGLSVVSEVRADAPVSQVRIQYSTTWSAWSANRDSLCQWYVSMRNAEQPGTTSFVSTAAIGGANGGGVCVVHIGTQDYSIWFSAPQVLCADGSAPDTTKPLDQQCGKPAPTCTQDAGKVVPGSEFTIVSPAKLSNDFSNGINFCLPVSGTSGGCVIGASDRTGTVNLTTGKWEYIFRGPFKAVGKVCTGNGTGSTDPVKDPVQKCDSAAGMCSGTVNGVEVCVRCVQSDTTGSKSQTTVNADGSTTQTTTNTNVSFNDNSVTTNTTTTTTTTPAGGGTPATTTKTDGTTESKDSYCQRNPNDPNCKESKGQVSGGDDCNVPPTCTGDAIQCAMVQQQYKTRCELQKSDEVADFGHALASGQDPDSSKLPTPGNAPEVNLKDTYTGLDNMGVVPACIPDVRINIPGMVWLAPTTLVISTEPLCDHGKLLGYLNIIATCFVCAYMLRGSF